MDEKFAAENLDNFKKIHNVSILPISCLSEEGIDDLKKEIYTLVKSQ